MTATTSLGRPRLHLRTTDSTNLRARELAVSGAPHGTLVTAGEQTVGRGRQGRTWSAPAGRALLCSLILRRSPPLLSLAAGLAVAEVVEAAGTPAALKWPNDVLVAGRKVAGILIEGRPQEGWSVLGVGVNVALAPDDFPPELRDRAGTLGQDAEAIEPALATLLIALERWVKAPAADVRTAFAARDALAGHQVSWSEGHGRAAGIDDAGRLLVVDDTGAPTALSAGEVHLVAATPPGRRRAPVPRPR